MFGSMTKKVFPVGERTKVYIRCRSGTGMKAVRFLGKPGRPCHQMLQCRVLAEIMLTVGAVSPFAIVARSVNGIVCSCRTSSGVAISSAAVMSRILFDLLTWQDVNGVLCKGKVSAIGLGRCAV